MRLLVGLSVIASTACSEQAGSVTPTYPGRVDEDNVRLSLYHACGATAACEQFAPRILKGVEPVIEVANLRCSEPTQPPAWASSCTLDVHRPGRAETLSCQVTYRRNVGPHNAYWSDEEDPPAGDATAAPSAVPSIYIGRSSLRCSGNLSGLTTP